MSLYGLTFPVSLAIAVLILSAVVFHATPADVLHAIQSVRHAATVTP